VLSMSDSHLGHFETTASTPLRLQFLQAESISSLPCHISSDLVDPYTTAGSILCGLRVQLADAIWVNSCLRHSVHGLHDLGLRGHFLESLTAQAPYDRTLVGPASVVFHPDLRLTYVHP
jgi:hypothetical protein